VAEELLISVEEFTARFLTKYRGKASISAGIIRPALLAARADLESKSDILLDTTEGILEMLMFEDDPPSNGQMFELAPPIQEITKAEIKYNEEVIVPYSELADYIKINPKTGQLSFFPRMWQSIISRTGFWGGRMDHIPLGFEVTYTGGYKFSALPDREKYSIQNAIGRRAMISNIVQWAMDYDLAGGKNTSMDGVSQGLQSGAGDFKTIIELWEKEEKRWVDALRRKHGTDASMIIV